jgi:hypothetical protein
MNLKIYKWISPAASYNAGMIWYTIRDLDLPEDRPCITISLHGDNWCLYSQMFPKNPNNPDSNPSNQLAPEGGWPDYQESSFMDLLLTTGILQSQIEYIFTNIDFDTHTISIQPRVALHLQMFATNSISGSGNVKQHNASGSKSITLSSSFGHAKPVQTWTNIGVQSTSSP